MGMVLYQNVQRNVMPRYGNAKKMPPQTTMKAAAKDVQICMTQTSMTDQIYRAVSFTKKDLMCKGVLIVMLTRTAVK